MLRVAAKQTASRCPTAIHQSIRHEASQPQVYPIPPSGGGGGFGKKLIGLTLATGAVGAGTVGYAYKDPEFRQTVETYIPRSKEVFDALIGPAGVTIPVQKLSQPTIEKSFLDEKRKADEQKRLEEQRRATEEQRRAAEEKRKAAAAAIEPKKQSVERAVPDEQTKLNLEAELRRLREISDKEIEERVRDYRQNLDVQYENRIRQTEALHADNLERVVKTLKQVHDAETSQALQEAVEKERRLHSKQIGVALEKLRGMEVALESRTSLDSESRRSKHFWLACQNLIESIIYGQKSGTSYDERRKPLEKEISVIASACENDQFVTTIAQYFSPAALQKGVYTEQDLKNRFKKVYKLATRTASIDENGGSLAKYLSSWIQSWFIIELPRVYSPDDKIAPQKLNNREIIARVRHFVDKGDFLSAVRLAQLLRGEPQRIAKDWIEDARTHLEARFLADLLLSHSAATSIRTIY